jgi:APA family basic amino acid/polyamine antiporter
MTPDPSLDRGLGFWQATAVNITQIVGAGVFATVPLILGHLPGVYGLLAWLVAGLLIVCDGMIWAELGAALPSAGGSYHFLRESFGREKWGRLMGFLFVWQILISGPLEVGSGLVAAAQFSKAVSPEFKAYDEAHTVEKSVELEPGRTLGVSIGPSRLLGIGLGVVIIALLSRRIATLGRLSVVFLVGILGVIAWVLVEGALKFDPALAFAVPPGGPPEKFGTALGAGMALAIYSYLGYYNVCYLGGEVRDPAKTIPRAILTSAIAVVVLFTLVQLAITGAIPWQEAAKETDNLTAAFLTKVRGEWAGQFVTVCLVGSCFVSAFSGMLGYSRVPYAAAQDGHFFKWFAKVHPTTRIPLRSLLLVGGLTLLWSVFSLGAIIEALIATRILEQFVLQIFALVLLRRSGRPMPWKMWLYPLPCGIALFGWLFVYATTAWLFVIIGAATLVVGAIIYFIRAKAAKEWPFITV